MLVVTGGSGKLGRVVVRHLMDSGYKRVRPLRGGLDAWIAAGYATEAIPSSELIAPVAAVDSVA